MRHRIPRRRRAGLLLAVCALVLTALAPSAAGADPPDPLQRGSYAVTRLDPFRAGLVTLQEPSSSGGAATGSASEITLQARGVLWRPSDRVQPSPLIVLVHGNHGSCDSGTAPACTIFKRNDEGYNYLASNLASWGYIVVSLDQDQLISRQDNPKGKGMHQRRLLIAGLLDSLYAANQAPQTVSPDNNLGDTLVGKIDFNRIGMMGHSRGGDAVTGFIAYNRMRPEPGRRYPLRGIISLAPTDYERKAPRGTPFMSVLPWCDGDVSNLMGARQYERGQYADPGNPFPTIQSSQLGANHNWYNTVWFADGDDSGGTDSACGTSQANHIRLTGQASGIGTATDYVINNGAAPEYPNKLDPLLNTRISDDPARMGDQEKIGLATMSAFFRRYVGGEGAFDPYLTGELADEGLPQLPASACPTSPSGLRMDCDERVSFSYFGGAGERLDVITPEADNPLGLSALGTKLSGSGFSNPYVAGGGVSPIPPTTTNGYDWCNPEPQHFTPSELGLTGLPTAQKPCPLPGAAALGGQNGTRENAPVNQSYGRQLALAWDAPAQLTTRIPKAQGDVSGFEALAMGADVNYFDTRNPARTGAAVYNPELTTQDFTIALTDAEGDEGTVSAADPHYGNALHQSTGSTTARMHIVLDEIRVPLEDFAAQGVDLDAVRKLELRFGEAGKPATGSIQLADVRFQEKTTGPDVLVDSTAPNAGPATGPVTSGPDPAAILEAESRAPASVKLPDVVLGEDTHSVWTVDDDKAQCPNASFTSIQAAINQAAPWDTIVVCEGLYQESSTPINHASSPSQAGSMNGLTITKPLKIKGAGAAKVIIEPNPALTTLAGTAPRLRDGGGNVITISRQSLGSTDDNEHFVEISGVTVRSPNTTAEAGIAFLNGSGRISDTVVGPLKRAADSTALAAAPHGWGVIATNSLLGVGSGTVQRQVTVDNSVVTGYQSGGILFDGARGTDGAADNTVRQGIIASGYVTDTIVTGSGPDSLIPQTGIRYHAGVRGFVQTSRITGNFFTPDQRQSVGILLTDAETALGAFSATGNVISGNGYGLYNANITNTAVREAAPATATGNYWGNGSAPIEGPSAGGAEGISGDDTTPADSVTVAPTLAVQPPAVPASLLPIADTAPVVSFREPLDADRVNIEFPADVLIRARDDFAVKSVELQLGGTSLGVDSTAPYEFSLNLAAELEDTTQTLTAIATDSSGQTTSELIEIDVVDDRLAPPLIKAINGKPAKPISPLTGFSVALNTSGEPGKVVYKLDGVTICTTKVAPYACSYLPTGADVGSSTLTATITDKWGRSDDASAPITVKRFPGTVLAATATRSSTTGPVTVAGSIDLPDRVTNAQGCHGTITIKRAADEPPYTTALAADCTFTTVLPPRAKAGLTVSFVNDVVLAVKKKITVVTTP